MGTLKLIEYPEGYNPNLFELVIMSFDRISQSLSLNKQMALESEAVDFEFSNSTIETLNQIKDFDCRYTLNVTVDYICVLLTEENRVYMNSTA